METEQKLGIKVFYYYLFKKITLGFVLLIASFFLLSHKVETIALLEGVFSPENSIIVTHYIVKTLFIVSSILLAIGIFISFIKYIRITFIMHQNALTIKSGIISKKEISIPYRNIQDVSILQSIPLRIMGVSKLIVITGGSDTNDKEKEAERTFEIIDTNIAKSIRTTILEKSNIMPTGPKV